MAISLEFNEKLFTQEEHYEEGPLRDRKKDFYGGRPNKIPEKRAELVRDVIALANTACIRRSPGYLLMGIDDDGNIVGIDDELLSLTGGTSISQQAVEAAKRAFRDVLDQHIEPAFHGCWDLKVGSIGDKHVAYLYVSPQQSDRPYQVSKKVLRRKEILLNKGECFIRSGESKSEISAQILTRDRWQFLIESPLILPSQWKKYLDTFLGQGDVTRVNEIAPVLALHVDDDSLLDKIVENFLNIGSRQLLVLQGGAGCGKSTFLWRLAAKYAEISAEQVDDIISHEEFNPPPGYIPIVLSLRGSGTQIDSEQKLTDRLLDKANALGTFWNERPQRPCGLFERPDLSWLICLDGLDEIWDDDGQRRFLNDALKPFMDRFPRTKLILTSRPFSVEAGFQEWNKTGVASIRPLTLNEISEYLAAALSSEAYDDALALLESEPDLQQICSHPAHLAAAVRFFGEGYEAEPADTPAELPPVPSPRPGEPESELEVSSLLVIDTETPEPDRELEKLASELRKELERSSQSDLSEGAEAEWHDDDDGNNNEIQRIPIPLGRVLNAIYEYLWSRETQRRNYRREDTDEWWDQTGKFALDRDGNRSRFSRQTACDFFKSNRPFYWLLHLAILKQISRRLYVFFTGLTQAYFAAEYVSQCIEADGDALDSLLNPCQESFQRHVLALLGDISSDVSP